MKNSMMFCKEQEEGKETFKLIPISLESPYLEVRFNLKEKMLKIISKEKFESFQMMPKLDENGNPTASKVNKGYKYERMRLLSFYDYAISDRKDIETLVNLLDSTVTSKDLEKYFVVEEAPKEKTKILSKDGE